MKIKVTNVTPSFNPVAITFTFESQDELDLYGSLFNYTGVTDALQSVAETHDIPYTSVYKDYELAGACIGRFTNEIGDAIINTPNIKMKVRKANENL